MADLGRFCTYAACARARPLENSLYAEEMAFAASNCSLVI